MDRSPPSWLVALVLCGASCAVHRTGYIEANDGRTSLVAGNGERTGLVLVGSASALRQLDGFLVSVDGSRAFRTVSVSQWRVLEGPHGLPVWVGPVQRYGLQFGVHDVNTGTLVWVDGPTAKALGPHVGEVVAIEGYLVGAASIQVVHWQLAR